MIKVIFYGLGGIGRQIARLVLKKKELEIVGALDFAPDLVGKKLGDVLGLNSPDLNITDNVDGLLSQVRADIVLHATVSNLTVALPQITKCIKAKLNVISTCEELSYPYYRHPELSSELANLADSNGVTVLGTGINPGYLMDTLPITLTGACQDVRRIKVTRMMNSSKRRVPFQKKIGEGLTPELFRKMIEDEKITGHVGLVESIAMIASAVGWKLDEIRELPPEPIIAERELATPYTTIQPGQVAGLKSEAHGVKGGVRVIELEFNANAAVQDEYDAIDIDGEPPIRQKIIGGVHGDLGTSSIIVNMIPRILKSSPGLVTMKDLPPVSAYL